MKTIEEKAIEYSNPTGDAISDYHQKVINNYKAGFQDAQRWIPVEEELPDILSDVLLKLTNGKITIGCLMSGGFNEELINESNKVSHWRPIEYK